MVWKADLKDGTYQNPILYVDYSDPDAIRVGTDYYMTASSFCNVPGLPVLHSDDLVNWELIGYALKKIPEFRYREPIHGCGVWAPAIRYHDGSFYICFPMPDEGLYMITAKDPAGEWDSPVKIYDGAGLIDPCPFWDEDGKAYLVCGVAKSRIGYKSVLYMFEMSPDGKRLLSGPVRIYDGTADKNTTTEGPKLYKRGGFYYIFAPAGGVKTGWQIVLRSKEIYGPYEVRTVMKQGKTGVNGPHQGAWVTDVAGNDWFLHFQDVFAAGRITHLQPMIWSEDGWPVIGRPSDEDPKVGEPVLNWKKPVISGTGDLGAAKTGGTKKTEKCFGLTDVQGAPALPWQWNANPQENWVTLSGEEGVLCLNAACVAGVRPLADYPSLLLRKWEAPEFCMEISLEPKMMEAGGFAGVMALGTIYGGIGVLREKDRWKLLTVTGSQIFDGGAVYAEEKKEETVLERGWDLLSFRLEVIPQNQVTALSWKEEYKEGDEGKVSHPESLIRISVWDGKESMLKETAFPASAGRWVGNKYGLFHVCLSKGENTKNGLAYFKKYKIK